MQKEFSFTSKFELKFLNPCIKNLLAMSQLDFYCAVRGLHVYGKMPVKNETVLITYDCDELNISGKFFFSLKYSINMILKINE